MRAGLQGAAGSGLEHKFEKLMCGWWDEKAGGQKCFRQLPTRPLGQSALENSEEKSEDETVNVRVSHPQGGKVSRDKARSPRLHH